MPIQRPFEYAFGDESGQVGFKFGRGSTKFFVFSLLLTNDVSALQEYVTTFRSQTGLREGAELKFHSTPDQHRSQFLTGLLQYDIAVRAVYVRKPLLSHEFAHMKSWDFYAYFVCHLLNCLPVGELGGTKLVLDDYGPLELTTRAIRSRLDALWADSRRRLIKRIRLKSSAQYEGLQAVDMAAGAIYRWLAKGDRRFLEIIQPKTLVWEFEPPSNLPT